MISPKPIAKRAVYAVERAICSPEGLGALGMLFDWLAVLDQIALILRPVCHYFARCLLPNPKRLRIWNGELAVFFFLWDVIHLFFPFGFLGIKVWRMITSDADALSSSLFRLLSEIPLSVSDRFPDSLKTPSSDSVTDSAVSLVSLSCFPVT